MNLGKMISEFDTSRTLVPVDIDVQRQLEERAVPAPFRVEPAGSRSLIGWRIWFVDSVPGIGPWVLRSVSRSYYWRAPTAWDRTPPSFDYVYDPENHRYVSSGIHLWRNEAAAEAAVRESQELEDIPIAYGACELLGRVIEHELGYRAQGVLIRSLTIVPDRSGTDLPYLKKAVPVFERLYDCDVTVAGQPEGLAMTRWHGRATPQQPVKGDDDRQDARLRLRGSA